MDGDSPLAPIGVDAEAEAVYRHLLARGGGSVEDVAAVFETTPEDALAVLQRLHRAGFIGRRFAGEFFTVDPRNALQALVEPRERQLAAVREAAGSLGEIFDAARRVGRGSPRTRVISGLEQVGDYYHRLKNTASVEICALDRPPFLLAPNGSLDEAAVLRGVRVRAVYAAASFDADGGWQELGDLVSRGEEARVVPALPVKLAMADRSAAMVSLSLSAGHIEYLYTEAQPVLDTLTEYFERYWSSASPLTDVSDAGPSPSGTAADPEPRQPTSEERALLALFAAGVKDEAIARQFGISSRTLRRRIQGLFAELGATNRFGAGAAAARRHWV